MVRRGWVGLGGSGLGGWVNRWVRSGWLEE